MNTSNAYQQIYQDLLPGTDFSAFESDIDLPMVPEGIDLVIQEGAQAMSSTYSAFEILPPMSVENNPRTATNDNSYPLETFGNAADGWTQTETSNLISAGPAVPEMEYIIESDEGMWTEVPNSFLSSAQQALPASNGKSTVQPGFFHDSDFPAMITDNQPPCAELSKMTKTEHTDAHGNVIVARLKYPTIGASYAIRPARIQMEIVDDDWQQCEKRAGYYVLRLIDALNADYDKELPKARREAIERKYKADEKRAAVEAAKVLWNQKQRSNQADVVDRLENSLPEHSEEQAWRLMHVVFSMHALGCPDVKQRSKSLRPKLSMRCSIRLDRLIEIVAQVMLVRWDVLRGQNLEDFVVDPDGYMMQKVSNMIGNSVRKQAAEQAAGQAIAAEAADKTEGNPRPKKKVKTKKS